jgi:hypothetical protein
VTPEGLTILLEQLADTSEFLLISEPPMFGLQRFAMCKQLRDAGCVLADMVIFMELEAEKAATE